MSWYYAFDESESDSKSEYIISRNLHLDISADMTE